MIPIFLAICATAVTLLAVAYDFTERRRQTRIAANQDPARLTSEVNRWARLIVTRGNTMRDLKRFENQVRFLAGHDDVNTDMIPALVGIAALFDDEQIEGDMDAWKILWSKGNEARKAAEADLGEEGKTIVANWLETTTDEHLRIYRSHVATLHFRR